jgi:hypothetical protein
MSPTPEEIGLGWNAYNRVRHYERFAAINSRQIPWIFAICATVLFVLSLYDKVYLLALFFLVPIWFLMNFAQNRIARARYADSKLILQLLQEKHGENLPWVMEERQLSAANALATEIARDKAKPA